MVLRGSAAGAAALAPMQVQQPVAPEGEEGEGLERAKGIEPSYAAWEAAVLPLNYARQKRA